MVISKKEAIRQKKLMGALEKWSSIASEASRPSAAVLAFLAGLPYVYKFEVRNILKGGT